MPSQLALELLRSQLPAHTLVTDPIATEPFETDGLTAIRQRPWCVVLAEDVAQVRKVLRICHECAVPVVTRGAGTGLSGGARPIENGVLLVLSKMNRILGVDLEGLTATVEPGATNLSITEAVAEHGLYYAPDPSSQIACSIGGNVAENSGGVHCLKYGLTFHNVIGLKVQTIEGDELVLGNKTYADDGYDMLALMIGSEGMLGVVTEIIVKLLPVPFEKRVLLAAFDSVEEAGDCVAAVIANGIVPAGLEMMDRIASRAAEEYAHAGYPLDADALLLCELDGTSEEVEHDTERVRSTMNDHHATSINVAETEDDRERLWRGRKSAFPAAGRIAPDYYCMDGTIPRHRIGSVLAEISNLADKYNLGVANVFHAGDGNLHPLILFDASDPDQAENAWTFGGEILERCIDAGGTLTGEHGVGVEKLDQMCYQFSDAELDQFHCLKSVFDPANLMNPGKAIPTLARCSELGGMHVHGGELPHPDIPRF